MLLLELDYEAEVKNLLKFRNSLAPDQRFLIPNVIHDFSSHDIICMEFIQGTTLSKVLELGELKEEEKKYLADTLLDLFLKEFFEFKMMQTDPNFANYLIQKDNTVNALKVVLLDFGATKQFSVEFVKKYFQLIEGIYFNDREKILKVSYELGIFSEKEDSAVKAIYLEFIQHCVQLFQKENNPYDFSKEDLSKKLFESGVKLFKLQRYSQPHSEMVFLHRKIGGLFSLLVKLKVQIDLNSFWSKIEHYGRQL